MHALTWVQLLPALLQEAHVLEGQQAPAVQPLPVLLLRQLLLGRGNQPGRTADPAEHPLLGRAAAAARGRGRPVLRVPWRTVAAGRSGPMTC
jgi:hypothetical protein